MKPLAELTFLSLKPLLQLPAHTRIIFGPSLPPAITLLRPSFHGFVGQFQGPQRIFPTPIEPQTYEVRFSHPLTLAKGSCGRPDLPFSWSLRPKVRTWS